MKPSKLSNGDLIAIISPSNTIARRKQEVIKACKNFERQTGLRTVVSPNAFAQHYYSAGTIQQRIDDFHWALKNPDVKAVIFSVGGNTAVELVNKLDYDLIKTNPKIISGISDATTLLDAITAKTGLITFLGIEFLDFAEESLDYTVDSIKNTWMNTKSLILKPNQNWRDFDNTRTTYDGWETIKPGQAEGKIIGGNFGSFAQLYHTEYMPSLERNILFMEFYKQPKKKIHQCLAQLKLWGAYEKISGLVMGYNLGSDTEGIIGNQRSIVDIVQEITEGYDFPAMWIGEVGHNVENLVLPIGAKTSIDATKKTLRILESVTN